MGVLAKVTKNLYLSQRMSPLNSKGGDRGFDFLYLPSLVLLLYPAICSFVSDGICHCIVGAVVGLACLVLPVW